MDPRMTARHALFIRTDPALHAAIEAAAETAGLSAAGWARQQLASAMSMPEGTPRHSPPRPKVRPVSASQQDLRRAVATLGDLGAALREHGVSPSLLAEIQSAVRVTVERVRRP